MTTSRSHVDQQLAALDELVADLQTAISSYRERLVDWDDVDALGRLQEQLTETARALESAGAQAELRRAARRVSVTVRQLAEVNP